MTSTPSMPRPVHRLRPRLRRRDGAVLVEFILGFVVVSFTLLVGLQFLFIFQARGQLVAASFFAAREFALTGDADRARAAAVRHWPPSAHAPDRIAVDCTVETAGPLGPRCLVTVTARYPLLDLPFLREFFASPSGAAAGEIALEARAASLLPP